MRDFIDSYWEEYRDRRIDGGAGLGESSDRGATGGGGISLSDSLSEYKFLNGNGSKGSSHIVEDEKTVS